MKCQWCYVTDPPECSGLCTTADKVESIQADIDRLEREVRFTTSPEERKELQRAIEELRNLQNILVNS